MHADAYASQPLSRIATALVAALLLCGGSAAHAQEDDFHISVSPNPATTSDPLVVTVTAADAVPCAQVLDPVVVDGIVWVPLTLFCPLPPWEPFPVHLLLDPLPPGIWDVRLTAADLPVHPPAVIDAVSLTVTDPRFSVRLAPSPASEEDEVVAEVAGEGSCPFLWPPPEIEPGRIRLRVTEGGICDPPPPVGPFLLEQNLGRLEPGDYLVELFFGDLRVAENELLVLPAGSCVPGETTLCLNRGRFRVEATWTVPAGRSGPARALEVTDDSGLFWFSSPGNLELLVKVLDGCALTYPRFWVFAAGATNLGVTIVVTDTETGAVSDYANPPGRRFVTITDTDAFATCP